MFCETCGKKLIRGYSFCVDCGTPVPPGAFDQEEEEAPVTELKPGMGTDDVMPGIAPKRTSDEGANLSSGSRVPLFNTDNTGLGGLGLDDPNQAFVNLFGNPSVSPAVNNSGFNSGSSNIDMPSIEAPAKTSQAKQKQPEKGEAVLINDFSMASAAGDETLEITDKAVTVLGGTSMEMGAGADIDLSPYKFLDNKIDMSEEPEPAAVQPEPVAVQPEPVAVQPEPVAVQPEPAAVQPEPAAVQPEPVAVQPEPAVVQPEPVAVQPEPVAVQPEPAAVQPEPVAVQPEPVAVQPEPVAVQPEPVAVQPEPVAVQPEPVAVQPEPAAVQPEPVAVQPEPAAVQPEPAAVQPEPVAVQPEPAAVQPEPAAVQPEPVAVQPEPAAVKTPVIEEDDFVPEEMQVIEESSPFIEETPILGATAVAVAAPETKSEPAAVQPEPVTAQPQPAAAQPKPETKSSGLPEPMAAAPAKSEPKPETKPNAPKKPAYDLVLGKLVYCKVCGQEMYEKEEVCKNCGARRGAPEINSTTSKPPKKLFGILPLSAVIGMASVVVVMTALIIFLAVHNGNQKVPVNGEISGSDVSVSSTSSAASSAGGSSSSAVSSSSAEPEESSSSSSSAPEESTPVSTSSAAVSSSKIPASTPKPASSPKSTPKSTPKSSSVKPQSSSKPPVVEPPSDKMTLMASIHETDRRKLAETAAVIEGEVGKLHVYSKFVTKPSDSDSKIPVNLTGALMNSIESGRKTVDSAMSKISSVNAELVSCRKAVENLRAKYDEYYNYVKKNSNLNSSTCNSYFNAFEQQLRTVRLNQYTSSYNSNDKRLASESMNSTAVGDINDTYSKFYNLRETFSKTSLNYADSAYNTLSSSSALFCDAVANAYKVKAYGILMGDNAVVKGNFDKLYQRIDTYISLDKYVGNYDGYYKAAY